MFVFSVIAYAMEDKKKIETKSLKEFSHRKYIENWNNSPEQITGSRKTCWVIGQINSSGMASIDDVNFVRAASSSCLSLSVSRHKRLSLVLNNPWPLSDPKSRVWVVTCEGVRITVPPFCKNGSFPLVIKTNPSYIRPGLGPRAGFLKSPPKRFFFMKTVYLKQCFLLQHEGKLKFLLLIIIIHLFWSKT